MRRSLILVLPMLLPETGLARECVPGTWRQAAPLLAGRTEVTAASGGHAVYLAGLCGGW